MTVIEDPIECGVEVTKDSGMDSLKDEGRDEADVVGAGEQQVRNGPCGGGGVEFCEEGAVGAEVHRPGGPTLRPLRHPRGE